MSELAHDQEYAWETLAGREAQYIAQHGTLSEITHKVGPLLRGAGHTVHDACLEALMDKNFSIVESVAVMVIWSRVYEAGFIPGRLSTFSQWYDVFGKYITASPDLLTESEKVIYEEVGGIIKCSIEQLRNMYR